MKKRTIAILTSSLFLGAASATAIGLAVAPIIKDKKFLNKIVNETVSLFKDDISKIYRETFHTRKIADFIKQYITALGLEITEDSYHVSTVDYSGNLYYDISATKGYENLPGVTLQAHMDMVCEADATQGEYDWSKGVDVVQEGNILHSRNHWTSIGADNGIGLSLLLTLTKHNNEFNHGPLRVIITADEENGDSGASALTSDVLKYDKIINVDGETFGDITKSCAGTMDVKYFTDLTWGDVTSSYKQYKITVQGMNGGHSATYIDQSYSAIKVANEVLTNMLKEANVELLQFTSDNSNNAIATTTTFSIATDLADIGKWIANQKTLLKKKYFNETKLDILCSEITQEEKSTSSLSKDDTSKINYVFDNIFFGVKDYVTEKGKRYIQTSSNIGPIELKNNSRLTFQTLIRSIHRDKEMELLNQNELALLEKFPSAYHKSSETPVWEFKDNVPLVDLITKAFNNFHYSTSIDVSHGWLECAYFAKYRPNADIASIGFNIENAHNPTECVHIDTIQPLLKVLLFTLQNIK